MLAARLEEARFSKMMSILEAACSMPSVEGAEAVVVNEEANRNPHDALDGPWKMVWPSWLTTNLGVVALRMVLTCAKSA